MRNLLRRTWGLLVMFLFICPNFVLGVTIDKINYYIDKNNNTAGVGEGNYSDTVVIPDKITYLGKTYTVTEIGAFAFQNCYNVTNVTIPNTIVQIHIDAFSGCYNLENFTIPNSVVSIGDRAFSGCTKLKNVNVGSSLKTIGARCFADCWALTDMTLVNSITDIGIYAFYGCQSLTKIVIPENVEIVKTGTFEGSGLEYVFIGNSVKVIDSNSFKDCKKIKTVEIGASLEEIGFEAFMNCNKLESINLPDVLTTINNYAFYGCSSLKTIVIPKSVKYIYDNFLNCDSLKTVIMESPHIASKSKFGDIFKRSVTEFIFGDEVTDIGSEAFCECSNLSKLTIPETVKTIGNGAFSGCKLRPLVVENVNILNSEVLKGLNVFSSVLLVPTFNDVNYAKQFWSGEIYPNVGYLPELLNAYLGRIDFVLRKNIYFQGSDSVTDVIVNGQKINPDIEGIYSVGNLEPDSVYDIVMGFSNKTTKEIYARFSTRKPQYIGLRSKKVFQTIFECEVYHDYDTTYIPEEKGIYIKSLQSDEWKKVKADSAGIVRVINLTPGESYDIRPYACYNDKEYPPMSQTNEVIKTEPLKIWSSLATPYGIDKIAIKVWVGELDKELSLIEKGVLFNDKMYFVDEHNIALITGLSIKEHCKIRPFVIVANKNIEEKLMIYGDDAEYNSKAPEFLSPQYTASSTSIKVLNWEYNLYGATLKEIGFTSPYEQSGNSVFLLGLEPDKSYRFYMYLLVEEDNYKAVAYKDITTPSLTLTTLKAKATSNTKAVICAETNICNEETGTGFEWRRIDAPDLVPSEEVYCAVHDGVMEGILNNLSPNTYYKYRPFYKSAKGNMYYGDWVGFGTADAYVYFTPTVHTYATATVEENSATLSGYALGGSDDVIEQGFEYWVDNTTTRAGGDVMTVTTTGQRMSVTLDGLMYSTTYRYRAYVKTATETTYGEEQIFTTGENPNGIVEHVMTKDRTEIDAPIYNLQGIRMKGKDNLPRGLYIQGGKKFIVK